MKLIKEYNVIDKRHLYVYETLWIKKSKSVNIRQPFGLCGTKIYKEMYKNKKRNHYRENKELYKELYRKNIDYYKEYINNNKDKIKEKAKIEKRY